MNRILSYIIGLPVMYGEDIKEVQQYLNNLGYLSKNDITGWYTSKVAKAIKKFQQDNDLIVNGITNLSLYNLLKSKKSSIPNNTVAKNKTYSRPVQDETKQIIKTMDEETYSTIIDNRKFDYKSATVNPQTDIEDGVFLSPNQQSEIGVDKKFVPFFNSLNKNTFRKSDFDIKLVFGENNQNTKVIKNVKLRSTGNDINPDGTPIYENIEFIGQDVQQNDNSSN